MTRRFLAVKYRFFERVMIDTKQTRAGSPTA
jgi:hypothetical protein